LLSLFGPKLPIDRDELEWQLATFKWLGEEFGSPGGTKLVTPTPEYFPSAALKGPGRVEALFADVKRAAGMEDWPCELEAGREDRPSQVGTGLLLRHEGAAAPCGTFMIEGADGGQKVVITYNPSLTADTGAMIATFAHELAHYLMSSAGSAPPGGWELHELHTDLAAVYLGFGIFLANSARGFSQFQSATEAGWSSRSQGYLSEGALVTALALSERLAGRDAREAGACLKPYLEGDLKAAAKYLAKHHPDMAASVAAIDLDAFVRE
jgi:hypothetical protein